MSIGLIMTLVIVALILCIFVSTKFNVNGGVLALFAAWIIGCICLGQKISTLIGYWPFSVTFIFISTSLFFSIARENGTMDLLAAKLLYKVRCAIQFIPFMIFLVAFIVAAMGASAVSAQLFLSPLVFSISWLF